VRTVEQAFTDELKRLIGERIKEQTEKLLNVGGITNYEDYLKISWSIRGLRDALELMEEAKRNFEERHRL
jgi:hypothetical protein